MLCAGTSPIGRCQPCSAREAAPGKAGIKFMRLDGEIRRPDG